MVDKKDVQEYLKVARKFQKEQAYSITPVDATNLPVFNPDLFAPLFQEAKILSITNPELAYLLMFVLDLTVSKSGEDEFLKAKAAWYRAWAANEFVKPAFVAEAVDRARRGFDLLNEEGWVAACEWQLNALPWVRNNFEHSKQELKRSLAILEDVEFHDYAAQCRLSLAYAQMLTGDKEEAFDNVEKSEAYFISEKDLLNQALSWLHKASILRRQANYDEAQDILKQAQKVFKIEKDIIDFAKADFQLAYCHYSRSDDYQGAEKYFKNALQVFEECNLELWRGLCVHGLAQVNLQFGNISKARKLFETVRGIYDNYEIFGIQADTLNDLGYLAYMRGRFAESVKYFEQAEEKFKKIGAHFLTTFAISNRGEAFAGLGRLQDSLYHIERAREILLVKDNSTRLANCDMKLANTWFKLQSYQIAEKYLNNAEAIYQNMKQDALLAKAYNLRAEMLIDQKKFKEALKYINKAMKIAKILGSQPEITLSQRLFGEVMARTGVYGQAIESLKIAEINYKNMGMYVDRALCFHGLAEIYAQQEQHGIATDYWKKALKESGNKIPDIEWRVFGGLGKLAEQQGDLKDALAYYKNAIKAIGKIRRNFWQPSLVKGYLTEPITVLGSAIKLAEKIKDAEAGLLFIEGGKAQTLVQQLYKKGAKRNSINLDSLDNMRAEIEWLQNKIKSQNEKKGEISALFTPGEIRIELFEKIDKYNHYLELGERQHYPERAKHDLENLFDLKNFRQKADTLLGKNWMAIDYYLTGDKLIGVWLTTDECHIWQNNLSNRARLALEACEKMQRRGDRLTDEDLSSLGRTLIPKRIFDTLTPETYMLIAPHNALHQVPWPIIRVGDSRAHLVEACIPVNVIGLEPLSLICPDAVGRGEEVFRNGIMVGLSEFQGRYKELPQVDYEVEVLKTYLGNEGIALTGKAATWKALKELGDTQNKGIKEGLSKYDFFHVASHMFSDSRTGRLSGIALHDKDIWLDQLHDLDPLPRLVVLSGCNGIQSRIFAGDEHLGLAIVCLLAGAQRVVGSLWPVLDTAAANFVQTFYSYLFKNEKPSQALAHAQRNAIKEGMPWKTWGGHCCIGVP